MAKLSNMALGKALAKQSVISISSSFFGLCQKATYTATGSAVKAVSLQYSQEEGARLERALCGDRAVRAAAVAKLGRLNEAAIGNYLLEACFSADRQFAALQLFQYQQLQYQPVTEVCVFEGDEASTVVMCL